MPEQKAPSWALPLQLLYLAALVAIAVLYHQIKQLRAVFPDPAGPIPLGVPWWGALGGVTISFTGIFRHAHEWQARFNGWHVARPVLGAVAGSVGYLVFIVVIRASGAHASSGAQVNSAIFDLVAFLLGYREAVFREILRSAMDTLLAPGRRERKP